MHRKLAFFVAVVMSTPSVAAPISPSQDVAAASFDSMKELVGEWRSAAADDSPLRIRFSLTAGGSVLVEEWRRGDRPHSLTLYHRAGARLIATHYCPQGNQPRLQQTGSSSATTIEFRFLDATDLDPSKEAHLTALSLELSDKAVLVRREIYRHKGVDEPSELRLIRTK